MQFLATVAICVLGWALFLLIETVSSGGRFDANPALLCLTLLGFSIVSYIAWPSRWNILAHTQLAFGVVAYVIPVLLLGGARRVPGDVVILYTQIMVVGFSFAVVGTILGAWLATRARSIAFVSTLVIPANHINRAIPRRTLWFALCGVAGVLVAFWVMGFIPAFAADPFAAKFFRGEYAERYAPVAPIYRASTSVLAALLPLLTMYAMWRRKPVWIAIFLASTATLLLTLQREPAASGILLFIGILVAIHSKGMFIYFLGILAVYFAGSASYFVFAALGIGNFAAGIDLNPAGFLENVAAGAPDVADQFVFLQAWLANPVYAHGLTFFGGLIPGNFQWNPSVWSLTVTNPGAALADINSGGFRLPGPLWGYVNLGWGGAALIGIVYGCVTGYLAKSVSITLKKQSDPGNLRNPQQRERIVLTFVVYAALVDCAGQFFALSYVSVLQTTLVIGIVYLGSGALRIMRSKPRQLVGGSADATL